MAVQGAKGSSGSQVANNDGGTVIQGGNIHEDSKITNSLEIKDLGFQGKYGSQLVRAEATSDDLTDPNGLIEANPDSAGGFAQQYAYSDQNVIAIGLDATINGEPSNLQTPASDVAGVSRYKRNTHVGTTMQGKQQWVYPILPGIERVPGKVADANEGKEYKFAATTEAGEEGFDQAVEYNRQFPGELTYRTGAPQPVNARFRDMEGVDTRSYNDGSGTL